MFKKDEIGEVVSELQKGHKIFKAFEKGLEVAQALQGLVQNEKELKAAVESARVDLEKANAELVSVRGGIAAAREEGEKHKVLAKEAAATFMADAKAAAAALRDEVDLEIKAKRKEIDSLLDEANSLAIQVVDAKRELQNVNDAISQSKAALAAAAQRLTG